MKIHFASDLHFEINKERVPRPEITADILVLAGDISTCYSANFFKSYLNDVRSNFQKILFVLGNHEFYGTEYDTAIDFWQNFCEEQDISLLDLERNPVFSHRGKRIFGSTFWTDYNEGLAAEVVEKCLNDSRKISNFSANRAFYIHKKTIERLEKEYAAGLDLIISHHCPILIGHHKYGIDKLTFGFCSTDINIEKYTCPWIYGHTHSTPTKPLHTLHTNQYGYFFESQNHFFDKCVIIEI